MPQDLFRQLAEFRGARQIGAVTGEIDAGQHDLGMAALDQLADLVDHRAHRHRARIAAAIGDDAEGAAVVAAVLHLHEHPRQALLKSFHQMRRHLLDGHDVGDRDLLAGLRRRIRPRRRAPLRAARQASPRILSSLPSTRSTSAMPANISAWVCAAQPVTTMRVCGRSRLSRRIDCRACATASLVTAQLLMTMVSVSPASAASRSDHLGFEGVEAAAEGDDLDAHLTRRRQTAPDRSGLHIRRSRCPSSARGRRPRATRWRVRRRAA